MNAVHGSLPGSSSSKTSGSKGQGDFLEQWKTTTVDQYAKESLALTTHCLLLINIQKPPRFFFFFFFWPVPRCKA